MRRTIFVIIAFLLCTAALVLSQIQSALKVTRTEDGAGGEVQIRYIVPGQTLPWMEFGSQTQIVFSLPASGIIPIAYGGTAAATAAAARTNLGVSGGSAGSVDIIGADGKTNRLQFNSIGLLTNVTIL